jgi:hypothetical protein
VIAQAGQRRLADHPAVGHDHGAADPEALAEAGDGRDQRLAVSSVAGEHVPSDRPALAIDCDTEHQLRQVGAPVAAIAVTCQIAFAVAVEIDRGGVDEHQIELGREQVAVAEEQRLFELLAARCQPRQGAVEVVQRQLGEAGCLHRLCPCGALQVGAGGDEPLQGQGEGDPLRIELELPAFGEALQDLGQALPLPQTAEHQRRAPAPGRARGKPAVLCRFDDLEPGAEAHQRLQQPVELAGGHQHVAAAEAGHQLLAHAIAVADRADDLQVLVSPAVLNDRLDPHEHGRVMPMWS